MLLVELAAERLLTVEIARRLGEYHARLDALDPGIRPPPRFAWDDDPEANAELAEVIAVARGLGISTGPREKPAATRPWRLSPCPASEGGPRP